MAQCCRGRITDGAMRGVARAALPMAPALPTMPDSRRCRITDGAGRRVTDGATLPGPRCRWGGVADGAVLPGAGLPTAQSAVLPVAPALPTMPDRRRCCVADGAMRSVAGATLPIAQR